jgi:hypothetical protein
MNVIQYQAAILAALQQLTGGTASGPWIDFYVYDLAAALRASTPPPWYNVTTGRADVTVNPTNVAKMRGLARGYALIDSGNVSVITSTGDQRTAAHTAGFGIGVLISAIVSADAPVLVGW